MRKLLCLLSLSACSVTPTPPPAPPPAPPPEVTEKTPATETQVPPNHAVEVSEFETSEGVGVRPLCEPVGSKWDRPTEEERHETLAKVQATCDALGVTDCTYFRMVSMRESGVRPWARHTLNGDVVQARRAYAKQASRYGWSVSWPRADREAGNTDSLEVKPARKNPNPWYQFTERWISGGIGLHGLNVVLHLAKWDKDMPPEVLCDPVVSTIITIRIARRAVARYNATTWVEVNAVFAGRTGVSVAEDGTRFYYARTNTKRDKMFLDRAHKWNLNPYGHPVLGKRLGLSPTPDQDKVADKVRGAPLVIPEAAVD